MHFNETISLKKYFSRCRTALVSLPPPPSIIDPSGEGT